MSSPTPTAQPTDQYEKLSEELNLALFSVLIVSCVLMIIIAAIWIARRVRAKQLKEERVCDFVGCCCGPNRLEKVWIPFRASRRRNSMAETKQFSAIPQEAGSRRLSEVTDI